MNEPSSSRRAIDLAWKVPVIAIAYFVGTMTGGAVVTAAKLPWPSVPGGATGSAAHILGVLGALLMALSLAFLARVLRGSPTQRFLVLAAFTYVVFGLSNQIEASIFTTFGGTRAMVLFFVFPAVAGAFAAAALVRRPEAQLAEAATAWPERSALSWSWRVLAAWLAFPVIYVFFGMLVAPIVVPFYQQQDYLSLPGWGTMLPVVLLRSALCLAVTLPLLARWSGSRRRLVWGLGLVLWAMMGLIGLATTTFLPPVMRVAHSLEILGDSMVYAWVLAALFVPKAPALARETTTAQA